MIATPAITRHFDPQSKTLTLTCEGHLDLSGVGAVWQAVFDSLKHDRPASMVIEASKLDYCDSVAISFFLELKHCQEAHQGQFSLRGLKPAFQQLVEMIDKASHEPHTEPAKPLNFFQEIGKGAVDACANAYATLAYVGELTSESMKVLRKPRLIRWKDFVRTIETTGPNALPIVLLLGFLLGLILAFQSAIPLRRFGALIYIANLVGISLTRELGPLMVAIILAGRTASAFAAEIGTMKVNQEIDALKTMGFSPIIFLVVPRILAVMLMTPVLNVFMIAMALFGTALFMKGIGYSWDIFYHQVNAAVKLGDFWGGMFKSFIFGIVIAAIGCKHGLSTGLGARAVGDSTTEAVVSCIVMIVVLDGIFAVLFYILGF